VGGRIKMESGVTSSYLLTKKILPAYLSMCSKPKKKPSIALIRVDGDEEKKLVSPPKLTQQGMLTAKINQNSYVNNPFTSS
jgi:hypothetical protein